MPDRLKLVHKLILLTAPLALLLLAGGILYTVGQLQTAARLRENVTLANQVAMMGELIHDLQTERGLSNGFLNAAAPMSNELLARRSLTSSLLARLRHSSDGRAPAKLHAFIDDNVPYQDQLDRLRGKVDDRLLAPLAVFDNYSAMIEQLSASISLFDSQTEDILALAQQWSALQCQNEYTGRARGLINGVLSARRLDVSDLRRVSGVLAQVELCGQLYLQHGGDPSRLARALQATRGFEAMRDALMASEPGALAGAPSPGAWFQAASRRIDALYRLQQQLLREIRQRSAEQAQLASRHGWLALGCLLALLLPIAASILLARDIIRTLGAEPADVAQCMRELADGHLDFHLPLPRRDSRSLASHIRKMGEKLAAVIAQVQADADSVANASLQLNDVSQSLAISACGASSRVESASATVDGISGQMPRLAEQSRHHDAIARQAAREIAAGKSELGEAARAMRAIARLADRLENVAGQLEPLVRRGAGDPPHEADADAIRRLAESSQLIAREISLAAAQGARFSENADAKLDRLADCGRQSGLLLSGMLDAAAAQTRQVDGVAEAMRGLSRLSQENAATSEQLSAAAREVAQCADSLRRQMTFFQLSRQR